MKILLVSDIHHFSTLDIYNGYDEALRSLNINYEVVPVHELVNQNSIHHFSLEGAYGLTLAKLLNKANNFTHCLCISGLTLPEWFMMSMYDKKLCILASDDPHASKILNDKKTYINYWFSNEKNMVGEKIFYLPTATSSFLPTVSKSEISDKYKSDIVFVGTIYKDREKPLEEICQYCEEKELKIKIIGPLLKTKKDSIIRKYADHKILNNKDTKLYYRGATVTINIDRNVNWNPTEEYGNSLLIDVGEPYSINPRAYEIAGCRSIQLYINPRKEAKDIFEDNIYYANNNNIIEILNNIFNEKKDILLNKINNCFNIVTKQHTYINRTKTLIKILETN